MPEISGLDTIINLVGEPPSEISINISIMEREQILLEEWNKCHIAVIPFCYKCKTPLVWHSPPNERVLFHCPQCNRLWIKDDSWSKRQ